MIVSKTIDSYIYVPDDVCKEIYGHTGGVYFLILVDTLEYLRKHHAGRSQIARMEAEIASVMLQEMDDRGVD